MVFTIEAIHIDIKFLSYFDIPDMRRLFSRAQLNDNMTHVNAALNYVLHFNLKTGPCTLVAISKLNGKPGMLRQSHCEE